MSTLGLLKNETSGGFIAQPMVENENISRGRRILEAIKGSGKRQNEIANALGITPQAVTKWIRTGKITRPNLRALSEQTGYTTEYLDLGLIPKTPDGQNAFPEALVDDAQIVTLRRIPIRGIVQGGKGKYWEDMGYPPDYGDEYVDQPAPDAQCYALVVRGDSMGKRIQAGDAVIVSPNNAPVVGQPVVVKSKSLGLIVKELVYRRGGYVALDAVGNGERMNLPDDDIEFMHKVTGVAFSDEIKHR